MAAIAGGLAGTPLKGVQLLGTNLLNNPKAPAAQLTALQGIIFPDAFFAGDPNPEVQKFIAAYRQQYGEEPDYLAAQGYVVLRVMARVAESAPGPEPDGAAPAVAGSQGRSRASPGLRGSTPSGRRKPRSISSPSRAAASRWSRRPPGAEPAPMITRVQGF